MGGGGRLEEDRRFQGPANFNNIIFLISPHTVQYTFQVVVYSLLSVHHIRLDTLIRPE